MSVGALALAGWLPVATASTVVLGDPAWRAPDGVGVARVARDGAVWVLSKRGEVTGFAPDGQVRSRFQACPDRGVHLELVIDAAGTRAGVDCGPTFQVHSLPRGEQLFAVEAFTVDAAFSPDGREIGLLGERIVDGVSEDTSWLLRFDATSGEPLEKLESEWEALFAVRDGWVGAYIDGDRVEGRGTLVVEARNEIGQGATAKNVLWRFEAPDDRRATWDWGPREAVTVLDGGAQVCVQLDFGGTCLDGRVGAVRHFWSHPEGSRSEASRARPHPDGLRVGDELWFLRGSGADEAVWRWSRTGDPVPVAMPEGVSPFVPATDSTGRHRIRVETARVVPVDETLRARSSEPAVSWDLPVSVDRTADGGMLAVLDAQGRVFVHELVGGARRIPTTVRDVRSVRIEPEGKAVWVFADDGGSARIEPDHPRDVPFQTGAVAFATIDDTRVSVGIATHEGVPHVGRLTPGDFEPWAPVAEALEVTGLQVVPNAEPDRVLVEYAQDDAFHPFTREGERWTRGPLGAHPFLTGTDIQLGPEGVFTTEETEDGWTMGPLTVPFSSRLRWLPDPEGTPVGIVHLPDDTPAYAVHDPESGALRNEHSLPARWSDAWTFPGVVVVALRDGRLMIIDE